MRNPVGNEFSRGHGTGFPQREAGSKDRREPSVEVRPLQGGATALEFEGIALPAGPGEHTRLGVGTHLKPFSGAKD